MKSQKGKKKKKEWKEIKLKLFQADRWKSHHKHIFNPPIAVAEAGGYKAREKGLYEKAVLFGLYHGALELKRAFKIGENKNRDLGFWVGRLCANGEGNPGEH